MAALALGLRRHTWSLLLFVGVPVVGFCALTAAGHPPMIGDDVVQNFPLRVLAGQLIRHGHLPLWNPYLWSGTPLLAGSNAGALYPGTLLFAVLPAAWAWTVNVIAVYAVAGIGMQRLLADYGVRASAALGGAGAYATSGFLTGQLQHIGLVQGASLLPWLLLGLRRRNLPGIALVVALIVLTGEPRSATLAAVVVGAGAVDIVVRQPGRRRFLVTVIAAIAIGLAVSAVYWYPALRFTDQSQRGHTGFSFFATGSLEPIWLGLVVVPYVMGAGNHLWHRYFGLYGLGEISPYAGLFAVFAVGTKFRDRRCWLFYALLVVGALLAIGGFTPIGHLLHAVPFYKSQRLQSRNLALVDFALAALLGFWLDARPTTGRLWYAVPVVVAVTATTWGLAAPRSFAHLLDISAGEFHGQLAYLLVTVGLCLAAALIGWRGSHRLVLAFLFLDLGLAAAGQPWSGPALSRVQGHNPLAADVRALLPAGARFAVFDPAQTDQRALQDLGAPDVNVLTHLPSVQGYGSVVSADYEAATGTHTRLDVNVAALERGVFAPLNLGLVLLPGRLGPPWRFAGMVGPYAAYRLPDFRPRYAGNGPIVATGELRRAVAYAPGWRARISPTRTLAVQRDGLTQIVRLPPGRWTVRFEYDPTDVAVTGWVSLAGAIALLGAAVMGRRR